MNYGLYLSAGGALMSLHRQDVIANNLANINTVGYKPDDVAYRSRLPERTESGLAAVDPQLLLEQLGGGQFSYPTLVSQKQGELNRTDQPLDLAVQGEGFFIVNSGRGSGPDAIRFTRDGRFTLNPAGELVMTATGMGVLDVNDRPIALDRAQPVQVNERGEVLQRGTVVAQLQIVRPSDVRALRKEGQNLFTIQGATMAGKRTPAAGMIRQGHVEASAVDPIVALNRMINASKAVQANATMMQYHDAALGEAINTFGRVA